jgi:hypothetical protein
LVEIEVIPEPTEDERAAILAALARETEQPEPEVSWQEDPAQNP